MRDRLAMAQPEICAEDIEAVANVMRSGQLSLGKQLPVFEERFAGAIGASHAAGVSSGTAALMLALIAAGVRPGDEVITVSLSFIATANAILAIGAVPVFVDVRSSDLNMDPGAIRAAVTARTRAIVVVHLFGQMADMDAIIDIADAVGVPVIEDACEAVGASSRGRFAGTLGTAAAFGFYPNKPITTAEGGMIVSNDERLIERCKDLRNQGRIASESGIAAVAGYSFRLSELHAALGNSQLDRLSANLDRRRDVARRYREFLCDVDGLRLPAADNDSNEHSWFTYPVRLPSALKKHCDEIRKQLAGNDIDTRKYFTPIHQMPGFGKAAGSGQNIEPSQRNLPVTDSVAGRLIALPLYPELTVDQIERVSASLIAAIDRHC